ncbi:alpha-amylase family protein [Cohnella fermenti]|uniref:Glycoside hydrolase n=1 Tax=Cohnella fermenti TaxID=2565925 RepID=A0A4S4BMC5_9BACL|nr:alpha-amylase family protein [Cohnella fermenti]THF73560.1 glycoside hydrolase [Cohnella fermenti]
MVKKMIFYDAAFPGAPVLSEAELERVKELGMVVGAAELGESLKGAEGGCFVTLHAPYFPVAAWEDILAFLKRGGGLINAGGAPFRSPVRAENGEWKAEVDQTAYYRHLRIHEMLPVRTERVVGYEANEDIPVLAGLEGLFDAADTWNLVPHVTKTSDLPDQMGSAGPMDAHIYPLLKGVTTDGREVAAPIVLWENTKGDFAGGRWLFVNRPLGADFGARGGLDALAGWIRFVAAGVTELWLKPGYASYELHERPLLTLQAQKLGRGEDRVWTFDISVEREDGGGETARYPLEDKVTAALGLWRLPIWQDLAAGYHRVVCRAEAADGEIRILRQGFWAYDAALLAEGTPVSAGRDYFEKDGRPLPVVGMTYMTSDVARKFLFLPNVSVWDRDMAQMRRAGINWIRTGIWTAYRNLMQVDGHASEEVLRSIDAFILTAKKHGLQLTFTFFSFTPETWEGTNPYLDPRSVEAQKRFIRSIVSRHKNTKNIDWDLINEPSMFDPPRIFSNGPRSARDRFEQEAYAQWLEKRHGSIELLRERWSMTPGELPSFAAARIPEPEEINFDVQDMHQGKKGTRWLDYALFSMDMHNRWARELTAAIKEECPDHLVTVGQDEALGAQRPSPFFYGSEVDYTTVHSWWLNDQLLWDGIFAKTADKPNLIQETGIMYVETPEGLAKRSEEELRSLLERKYAYAFATGGAGAVHWIWNTNFYMDNANESHIGAVRADGTEKPEADVSYDFGAFAAATRDLFRGRRLEDVAVVFPYSNDFSNRKLAYDATTKLTRVLSYELKVPFRGVSEYDLKPLRDVPAKLIVLPSAHNVDDSALAELLAIVGETGATLVLTGPAGIDAYWRHTERLADVLGERRLGNVVREERLELGGRKLAVSYGQRRIAEVAKESLAATDGAVQGADGLARAAAGADRVVEVAHGKGRILWTGLPLELNDRSEPIAALYEYALAAAGCGPDLEWVQGGELPGVYGRKLAFAEGALFVFVSEYAWDTDVEVKDPDTGAVYSFLLERERSVLFAADGDGKLIASYRSVDIAVK